MGELVNEITFFTHRRAGELRKSQEKVVVDIEKFVYFLVWEAIANLGMQQGKSTPISLASTWSDTLWDKPQSKALQLWSISTE
jgi:hypothetical protein